MILSFLMLNISWSLKNINKTLLLATLISLAFNLQKGSFSRHFIPNAFQILLVITLVGTAVYVLKKHAFKDFFLAVPKKILQAIVFFYVSIFLGWFVSIVFLDIPTTIHTILDFGTFTMGIVLFFLVSYYAKDDKRYANWCLYAILIPNAYLIYYFLTHGFIGYWGVPNDRSLDSVLDPNILSKTLLVPALFFITKSLHALREKTWKVLVGYGIGAAVFSMLVFWTVSRGASLSLVVVAVFIWLVFSFKDFSWKNLFLSGMLIMIIFLIAYSMLRSDTQHAIYAKSTYTITLPDPVDTSDQSFSSDPASVPEKISYFAKVTNVPNITKSDIQADPRIDLRYLIWYFYPRYIIEHPLGVGPNASWDFGFTDKEGSHIYVGPDSTYLIVCLWGGIIGIISYMYILVNAFIGLWKSWKNTGNAVSFTLFGIFCALSAALFFDGMLSLYSYYVVLGLAFLSINRINNHEL